MEDTKDTPLFELVQTTLRDYNEAIRALLESLASPAAQVAAQAGAKRRRDIMADILRLDRQLQSLYFQIKEHQVRQEQIRETQQRIAQCDALKSELAGFLFESKDRLDHLLSNTDERISAAREPQQHKLDYNDILDYANKISAFTSAPPNFNPRQPYMGHYELPYPSETYMHASILNHLPHILKAKKAEGHGTHHMFFDVLYTSCVCLCASLCS
ncbi:hypothetical protein EV182_001292 [Spiromyces aspiralis]|uniref:Uncharacterized protein n=1 Tax=Spiromyces aspiralis TaxID=68401 RepID=A0ACC1HTP1_9FUNG|nr:hypothetical protein EV182_001292 [Spiromyces aspiralis]